MSSLQCSSHALYSLVTVFVFSRFCIYGFEGQKDYIRENRGAGWLRTLVAKTKAMIKEGKALRPRVTGGRVGHGMISIAPFNVKKIKERIIKPKRACSKEKKPDHALLFFLSLF